MSKGNYNLSRLFIIAGLILIGIAAIFGFARSIVAIFIAFIAIAVILAGWIIFIIESRAEKKRIEKERESKKSNDEACCGKTA